MGNKKKKKTTIVKTKLVTKWSPEIKNVVVNGTKSYQDVLTQKQYDVLTNWMTGQVTQSQVGNKLGICQTSIHKSLFGNIDYVRNKRYGGIFKKIQKFDSGNYVVGPTGCLRKK